jgi:hypothetical protein
MAATTNESIADLVRQHMMILCDAVREMSPAGALPIPVNPSHFNLLARPHYNSCRVCGMPGHSSLNINTHSGCHTALLSMVGFWEDMLAHVSFLYSYSNRFKKAITDNEPTYDMRLDDGSLKGGALESVLVERLTRSWLKFAAHFARIRAKANIIMTEIDLNRYEVVHKDLNEYLLNGLTCKFQVAFDIETC